MVFFINLKAQQKYFMNIKAQKQERSLWTVSHLGDNLIGDYKDVV